MRALVTGGHGFAGRYLVSTLDALGYKVVAAAGPREALDAAVDGPRIDLSNSDSLLSALVDTRPDVVFHLGGQAFVPDAMERPLETFDVNAVGTVRLLEAIRSYARERKAPKVVFASSASVYGKPAHGGALSEDQPVHPVDPYGASKAAAEAACVAWSQSFGIHTVIARSFNHLGPGQDWKFVAASFARQLAEIKHGLHSPTMHVGMLSSARDFLDVRDVVRAYIQLSERGDPGEVYNVCSGVPVQVKEVLRLLIQSSHTAVRIEEDPARMRMSEVSQFYGKNTKIAALGWEPLIPLSTSLKDLYEYADGCVIAEKAQLISRSNRPGWNSD